MYKILEKSLYEYDSKKYNRFELIKKVLCYFGKKYKFEISNEYFEKILSNYLKNTFRVNNEEIFWDRIYNFYEEIIELYKIGNFSKHNFVLQNYNLNPIIKNYLKNEKENVLKFFDYYLEENSVLSLKNKIIDNNYIEIFKLKTEDDTDWKAPYLEYGSIIFRFMIKGKIYYSDGILLEENFYMITSDKVLLKKAKAISNQTELLIFVLKEKFVKNFNIIEPDKLLMTKGSKEVIKIFKLLENNFISKNPFYFIEILSFLLKSNNLLQKEIIPFSENLTDGSDLIKLTSLIEKYIKLSIEEIISILEKNTNFSFSKINTLFLLNTDLTLKKFIIRLKIKYLIDEFYTFSTPIENLVKIYNFKNIKNFRYNLKVFYNISIKDLKKIR